MLTSKQRAELRSQANGLEVTLMIGKEGVTGTVAETAVGQLENRELIKGRVLETAGLSAREASDLICKMTGAEGVSCVGNTFVIYRRSKKMETQRAKDAAKERAAKKVNPVRAGIQRRRAAAKKQRERKDEFFRQQREKERREKK
jgi:RNA-binding protein